MTLAEPAAPAPASSPATTTGAAPALWCSGLRKRYGRRQALDGVGFEVGRGEVLGLLGPNGAGKTTLIKILLGLVRPDEAEVMLLGRRGPDPDSRVGVGYLPELFRFQPWLSAREVIALHAKLARVDWPADRQQQSLLEVGLGERAADRVGGFSKGMQQRLGLAVALIGEPDLVILDEPTSALDPVGRADVRDIVVRLRDRGTTVVLNSHLIGEVERVCDRVVILDHGRVVASGTLAELLGRRRVRLRLGRVGPQARAALEAAGLAHVENDWYTVDLTDPTADPIQVLAAPVGPDSAVLDERVPDLVATLVGLGVRLHAVEPSRISLEDKLLGLLRGRERQ